MRTEPEAGVAACAQSKPNSVAADRARDSSGPEDADSSRLLDSILEHLPAMVFVKRASDLRFVRFNRAGERLLGVERDELLGKNDYDVVPHEQAEFFTRKDREVLASGAPVEIPAEPIQTPAGTRWLHTLKIPVVDEHGEPRHLLGLSMDITEQKHAEELLMLSHDDLQRRIKDRTAELERQMHELERAENALAHAQAELRHSQKMEAIGRLAGG
jgi:PAS domain S-box-containing protein